MTTRNQDIFLANLRTYLTGLSWFLLLLEAISGLVAGALLGSDIANGDFNWYTAVVCLLFLSVVLIHAFSNALFPGEAIKSIQLSKSLNDSKSELDRREELFKQLDSAVETLNKRTCGIQPLGESEESLIIVKENLDDILSSILLDPNTVFKCSASNFSIIARVSYYIASAGDSQLVSDYAVLRDDLALTEHLKYEGDDGKLDVFEDLVSRGLKRELGNFIRRVYNENCYSSAVVSPSEELHEVPESGFTFVGVPIPLICEGSEANGVLLIAANSSFDCAGDIPAVLKTHGRLIANWLFSYENKLQSFRTIYETHQHELE